MTRVFRLLVTVSIEGERLDLPELLDLAEYVATQVQDEDGRNLAVCVRGIEWQDFSGAQPEIPLTTAPG